jgi:hypothetical protein
VAFVDSIRSMQPRAMAPAALKIGKLIMMGGTDSAVTDPSSPWLLRCRPNDW